MNALPVRHAAFESQGMGVDVPKVILILVAAVVAALTWAVHGGGQPKKDLGRIFEWLGMMTVAGGAAWLRNLTFSWHSASLSLLAIVIGLLVAVAGHQLIKLAEKREASKEPLPTERALP